MEAVIKKIKRKTSQQPCTGPDRWILTNVWKEFNKFSNYSKKFKRRESSQAYFMRPALF